MRKKEFVQTPKILISKEITNSALHERLSKENIIIGVVIFGFVISIIYHYIAANIMGHNFFPYNTFLSKPNSIFANFQTLYDSSKGLNPYLIVSNTHLPLSYIIMYPFTFVKPLISLVILTIVFIVFYISYIYFTVNIQEPFMKLVFTFVLAFMSFPFLSFLDRGSAEVWLFISITSFIYFYIKKSDYLCGVFLSLAIATNYYSAVLLVLLLLDKKYLISIFITISSIVLILASSLILKGTLFEALKGFATNQSLISGSYLAGGIGSLGNSTSLFAPLRLVTGDSLFLLDFYIPISIILFSLITYLMYRFKLSKWKTVSVLLFSFMLLPQISFSQNLVILISPIILFTNDKEDSKYNILFAVLFGLLLIPKSYFHNAANVDVSVVLNPLIMATIIVVIFAEANTSSKKNKVEFLKTQEVL